jgi:membrane protein implicated in regulation of membrane protease activity
MKDETTEILNALDDKEPKKKPSNWSLWSALYFAEAVFVILDAVSAVIVGTITGYWYYGLFVFLAGVVPLYLYTKQFTRPLASPDQRRTAMIGGVVAVASVIVIAVFMAVINLAADTFDKNSIQLTEAGLVASMVLILAAHAFIMGRYFFIDEEVKENQKTDRMIARGERGIRRIGVAQKVAEAKRQEVKRRGSVEKEYDPRVVAKILNLMRDLDEDGVPDIIDSVDNRTGKPFELRTGGAMAQTAERVNPTNGQERK